MNPARQRAPCAFLAVASAGGMTVVETQSRNPTSEWHFVILGKGSVSGWSDDPAGSRKILHLQAAQCLDMLSHLPRMDLDIFNSNVSN
jgi:hypothetical protein